MTGFLGAADYPQKREIGIYFEAFKKAKELATAGDAFGSQDTMAAGLDEVVPGDGVLVGYFLKRRNDIILHSIVGASQKHADGV